MPKFNGSNDPKEYLSWALKVDKIFRLHNYEEEKKIAMASVEFQDYVLIWWEQVIERREAKGEPPITTWAQMKDVMRARFVPTYYTATSSRNSNSSSKEPRALKNTTRKWRLS